MPINYHRNRDTEYGINMSAGELFLLPGPIRDAGIRTDKFHCDTARHSFEINAICAANSGPFFFQRCRPTAHRAVLCR